jgi:hypothetical protein
MQKPIFYQHIYKNGGTSIREGVVPFNKDAAIIKIRNNEVLISYDFQEWTLASEIKQTPKFLIGFCDLHTLEQQIGDCVKIITLRDPITRLVSAYNYFIHHCGISFRDKPHIDFMTWFINKDKISPVAYESQINTIVRSYYPDSTDPSMHKFFYGKNHEYIGMNINDWAEIYCNELAILSKQAMDILCENYDHVWFLEDNYVRKFIDFIGKENYNLDYRNPPDPNKSSTNEYSPNIKWKELSTQDRQWVEKFMGPDLWFYQECKRRFG